MTVSKFAVIKTRWLFYWKNKFRNNHFEIIWYVPLWIYWHKILLALWLLWYTSLSLYWLYSFLDHHCWGDILLMQIWPPKNVKDSGSRLHTKLKEAIMQVIVFSVASVFFPPFGHIIIIIGIFLLCHDYEE